MAIVESEMPEGALLGKYRKTSVSEHGDSYVDCYSVGINKSVQLSDFIFLFYTSRLFKLERVILTFLVGKHSTDNEAKQLSEGLIQSFSAWHVEQRAQNQLLMCDFKGRTRSWFMVKPVVDNPSKTLLLFGSAVVPRKNLKTGQFELGNGFSLLLGFHKLYSKALLHSAKRRLEKQLP